MKRIAVISLSLLASLAMASHSRPIVNINSVLISKLGTNWKKVTDKNTQHMTLLEYIPRHQKAGEHSEIIAQVVLRNPTNTQATFVAYHVKKMKSFTKIGCEIKPKPSFYFANFKSPHEVFIYECPAETVSGLDVIVNAKNTSIYDLMFEVKKRKLSQADISRGRKLLSEFTICYDDNPNCESS